MYQITPRITYIRELEASNLWSVVFTLKAKAVFGVLWIQNHQNMVPIY